MDLKELLKRREEASKYREKKSIIELTNFEKSSDKLGKNPFLEINNRIYFKKL